MPVASSPTGMTGVRALGAAEGASGGWTREPGCLSASDRRMSSGQEAGRRGRYSRRSESREPTRSDPQRNGGSTWSMRIDAWSRPFARSAVLLEAESAPSGPPSSAGWHRCSTRACHRRRRSRDFGIGMDGDARRRVLPFLRGTDRDGTRGNIASRRSGPRGPVQIVSRATAPGGRARRLDFRVSDRTWRDRACGDWRRRRPARAILRMRSRRAP